MSAWIIALGLSAGYLINKNMQLTTRIEESVKTHHSAAKPATDGPPTETIREVQRSIPLADKYQDMNAQDLTRREMDRLAGLQEARHQEVAAYEAPSLPEISGVYLHLERGF